MRAIVKAVMRRALFVVVAAALAVSAFAATRSLASASPSAAPATLDLTAGRTLYRQFCGKCHALDAALSAGFGSNTKFGFGEYGGPSFNTLRVPYAFSVNSVAQPTGGHEKVKTKMTAKQLHTVAAWIAKVTRNHPILAKPTDG
jgi:mono/diheme cytochrome c family protein